MSNNNGAVYGLQDPIFHRGLTVHRWMSGVQKHDGKQDGMDKRRLVGNVQLALG